MDLQQGDCIRLPALNLPLFNPPGDAPVAAQTSRAAGAREPLGASDSAEGQLYQVVSIDAPGDRCWLRRWPLARHGSPVFELSLRQLQSRQPHRPHLRGPC